MKTIPRCQFGVRRALGVALGGVGFVISMALAVPSGTSVPDASVPPPTPEEVRLSSALTDWLLGGEAVGRFTAFSSSDLAAALRQEPQTFALFRRPQELAAESELLDELPYGALIERSARRHRVDALLLASVMETESRFDADAVSPKGAVGLMQVMPSTARRLGIHDPGDPSRNVEAGARYLSQLLRRFDQDVVLALAAYNAGPGKVERYGGVPPYRETRTYVERVLNRYVGHYRQLWRPTGDPPTHQG